MKILEPGYLAPKQLSKLGESSDDLACACVCVEFRFHLGHPYCSCACACVASENQALLKRMKQIPIQHRMIF